MGTAATNEETGAAPRMERDDDTDDLGPHAHQTHDGALPGHENESDTETRTGARTEMKTADGADRRATSTEIEATGTAPAGEIATGAMATTPTTTSVAKK